MVNLLPRDTKKRLTRRYYVRYAAVFFTVLTAALIIGGLLLAPSYLVSRQSADSYERYRDALEGAVGLKERAAATADVALLAERVRIMDTYATSAFTADFFDALGAEVASGIAVQSITFTRTDSGAVATLGGEARTRQELLAFVQALQNSPAFTEASLPVSQLVAEKDIDFSIQAVYEKR